MGSRVFLVGLVLALVVTILPLASQPAVADSRVNDLYVTADVANVRAAPTRASAVVTKIPRGEAVQITEPVEGEDIDGNKTWYRTVSGYFISETVTANKPAERTYVFDGPRSERWIDIDLSDLTARAMQGDRPVYEASIASGREDFQTPKGSFRIEWRAETRTMDSSTIGIPLDSEEGYLVPNVRYAQYFTFEGDAIHGNYWVPQTAFGELYSSHGCVGMTNEDAKAFWDFAAVGTRVEIHD